MANGEEFPVAENEVTLVKSLWYDVVAHVVGAPDTVKDMEVGGRSQSAEAQPSTVT